MVLENTADPGRNVNRENTSWIALLKLALKSRRVWRTFIRCWIVLIVALILMVCPKTSSVIGQASFFIAIVALMMPPSLASSVFIVAVTTMFIGMLLGWAWGNASMAAALHVRSSALLAQQHQKFRSSVDPKLPDDIQVQSALFHGLYLDPRSSAVYGAFFFIGTLTLGALRAHAPNLALLTIFATIVLDVICTTGPLIPTPQYMLAKSFILPTSIYVAVALAGLVLIFPESLSHVWLSSLLDNFLTPILSFLKLQNEVLNLKPSSDTDVWTELYARAAEIRNKLLYDMDHLLIQIHLIDLDFSIGRLGPADLRRIHAEIKPVLYRIGGIQSFQAFVNDRNTFHRKIETSSHLPVQPFHFVFRQVEEQENAQGHNLDSLILILETCSARLRKACEDVISCIADWVERCNKRRWVSFLRPGDKLDVEERHTKLVVALKSLQDALEEFRNVERVKLIKPYEGLFDPHTKKLKSENTFTSRSLFTSFVFVDTLDALAEQLAKFMMAIIEIDGKRTEPKFWFPGKIAKVKENLTGNEFKGSVGPLPLGTTEDPTTFNTKNDESTTSLDTTTVVGDETPRSDAHDKGKKVEFVEKRSRRNPDAFPPNTIFGKSWLRLAAFARFFKSPQGIFAMRHAFVSVALWSPAVYPPTAWFYYQNKGIWALIMAQIGLATYAGDQIANFFLRIIGTLIGLLVGMAIWYIGAGSGRANPYGIVVTTSLCIAPFLFARIALPPDKIALWLMIGVTSIFVVGYSWINTLWNSLGNPGTGINLGWKRALLVIIGFTAAFIVMLFPNPISSRVLVRKTLAAIINETGDILAGEVEAFLAEETLTRPGSRETGVSEELRDETAQKYVEEASKEERIKRTGKRVIVVSTRLRELHPSLTFANFEPQLSGTWPEAEYSNLFDIQSRSLGALVLLINSFAKLDPTWCTTLVHKTPFLNPNFLSDVFMTVSIVSNCLMHGIELPAHLPNLRDRLIYHAHKRELTNPNSGSAATGSTNKARDAESEDPGEISDIQGIETEELTLDVLMDEHLPAHATAVLALSSFMSRIEEAVEIVRKLCGEATFRGYDSLQQFYIDQEKAVGGIYHVTHL